MVGDGMSVTSDGLPVAPEIVEVSLTSLCERIAEVLKAPEWSPDDGRHLIAGVSELTPEELGRLHPFALADTAAMQRRHDRRIDLVVALRRRLADARYGIDAAAATLERLATAARYDPIGPAGTVATAIAVLTRCATPDTPAVTDAAVRVLAGVHRVLRDRGALGPALGPAVAPGRSAAGVSRRTNRGVARRSQRATRLAGSTPPPPAVSSGADTVTSATMPWERPLDLATLAAMPGGKDAWPDAADRLRDAATSRWDASYRSMLTRQRWQELMLLRRAPELRLDGTVEPVVEIALGPDEVPGYRAWLRELLEEALRHARDVQAGRVPFHADVAFNGDDALLVARAALQALVWDEPWAGAVVSDLLPAVALARDLGVRSTPSSTLTLALARAVARAPTAETVTALEQTLDAVSHAGMRKKLRRHLGTAQDHLELQASRTLREASDGELAAGDLTALARSLEHSYLAGATWPLEGWLLHVRAEPRRADLVSRLLWLVTTPDGSRLTVRGHPEPGGIDERWVDVRGEAVLLPAGSTVALWHPLPTDAGEREAWTQVIWNERIEQPFQQAYREHYDPQPAEPGLLTDFAGTVVDLEPFLDAAHDHGWTFDRPAHRLVRRIGANWAQLSLTYHHHPDAKEANALGPIVLSEDRDGHRPWQPGVNRDQRIQVSEVLRSVDLMLARCGLLAGSEPETPTLAGLATAASRTWADVVAMRREVLARAIVNVPGARLGSTHLHVGGCSIHLRSGRIAAGGEEVPLAVEPLRAVTWLPYDDGLLGHVLAAAIQCSDRVGARPAAGDGRSPTLPPPERDPLS